MSTVALYRCTKCGTRYRPLEAGARRDLCCGTRLERVPLSAARGWFGAAGEKTPGASEQPPTLPGSPSGARPPSPVFLEQSSTAAPLPPAAQNPRASPRPVNPHDGTRARDANQVTEIIPPREHCVDESAVERMFAALGNAKPVAVEIAADAEGVRFLLRGAASVASRVQHHILATYGQARFRPVLPDQDLARAAGTPCATAKLSLRKLCYLPLVTFREGDFAVADPLSGLLGVFTNLAEGERLLSQLILTPAPRSWGDRYASYTHATHSSTGEPLSVHVVLRQGISLMTVLAGIALFLCAFFALVQHRWLEFLFWAPLAVLVWLAAFYLFFLALGRANLNFELVQRKIESAAYDVSLRLVAFAPTAERARDLVHELARAYRQYDLANGNALIAHRQLFDPQIIAAERASWWNEFTGKVNRLNVAELAALWHLPLDQDVPLVERTQAKRLLPRPQTVREGILIGHSEHQGHRYPVHLGLDALWGHSFMVAKTQAGKSTLMAHLATAVMRQAERTALVVIDPHGDLVRSLLPLVPPERVEDVVYIDFSEPERAIGLNVLDMNQGRDADAIVSNIVHVGELIWHDFWGPRMEDVLRYAVRTLLEANGKLVARGEPQFTLLDIPPLLQLENFRHRLVAEFVTSADLITWWESYLDTLTPSFQMEVVNPVLTKLHRFAETAIVRRVVGQSSSSVNFREILTERKLLLVNTATGIIGPDAGGLLGAVIVDFVNFAVRAQMAIHEPQARARVAVVVDEFQTIIGVDYPGLLAELQKMGASFILATQALGQLRAISPKLHASIFANIASLFCFQTSAEDAEFLAHELKEQVSATDIISLAKYACYLRVMRDNEPLPVMSLQTLPPEGGLTAVADRIWRAMDRYTRPVGAVDWERARFQTQWYGRELDALRRHLMRDDKFGRSGRPIKGVEKKEEAPGIPEASSSPGSGKNRAGEGEAKEGNRQGMKETGEEKAESSLQNEKAESSPTNEKAKPMAGDRQSAEGGERAPRGETEPGNTNRAMERNAERKRGGNAGYETRQITEQKPQQNAKPKPPRNAEQGSSVNSAPEAPKNMEQHPSQNFKPPEDAGKDLRRDEVSKEEGEEEDGDKTNP